jgi:hypothetical protein
MDTQVSARTLKSQDETADPNLHVVFLFCVIGLVVTLFAALRFPEVAAALAQLSQLS